MFCLYDINKGNRFQINHEVGILTPRDNFTEKQFVFRSLSVLYEMKMFSHVFQSIYLF